MKELELIVGARVYCRNGKFGRLAKIAVEPEHGRVTHIIVEEGFLRKRFRLLPISIVEQATTGDVYLAVCDEDMARFPELVSASDGQITDLVLQQRMISNSLVQHIDEERISGAAIAGDGARAHS